MSMLIRRGTIVRKASTRKSSVRRTRSAGSAPSSGGSIHGRPPPSADDEKPHRCEVSSVPASPVAKLHHVYGEATHASNSPGKASVVTNSTIVSFDECRLSYKTSIERKQYSCDRSSLSAQPDTALQIEEANKEADSVCDFVCTASRIVCSSSEYQLRPQYHPVPRQ
ncbi:hypothetical protein PoB_002476900 [Plakobranchus ocellatus]|uniref:Uncharacterized protein n=1 Tax=Plakobranchus ocellatus TaxID=259542 RepID=A0AAV3ZSF0_9GAST|nr:hypothetical protein PoB_002476900 [Plakobranchus ocellatus]